MSNHLEWDELKRQANLGKHKVDFSDVREFVWTEALIEIDSRRDYGETRWTAFGSIRNRLHVLVYSERAGATRLISLRKANQRKFDYYVSQTDTPK